MWYFHKKCLLPHEGNDPPFLGTLSFLVRESRRDCEKGLFKVVTVNYKFTILPDNYSNTKLRFAMRTLSNLGEAVPPNRADKPSVGKIVPWEMLVLIIPHEFKYK